MGFLVAQSNVEVIKYPATKNFFFLKSGTDFYGPGYVCLSVGMPTLNCWTALSQILGDWDVVCDIIPFGMMTRLVMASGVPLFVVVPHRVFKWKSWSNSEYISASSHSVLNTTEYVQGNVTCKNACRPLVPTVIYLSVCYDLPNSLKKGAIESLIKI